MVIAGTHKTMSLTPNLSQRRNYLIETEFRFRKDRFFVILQLHCLTAASFGTLIQCTLQ